MFNIQSIEPTALRNTLEETEESFLKENRRSTHPNLESEESLGKREIAEASLMNYLDIRTFKMKNKEISIRKRNSKFKLKEINPSNAKYNKYEHL